MPTTASPSPGAQQRQRRRRGSRRLRVGSVSPILPAARRRSGDALPRTRSGAAARRDHGHLDGDGHRGTLAPFSTSGGSSTAPCGVRRARLGTREHIRVAADDDEWQLHRGRFGVREKQRQQRRCGRKGCGGAVRRFCRGRSPRWPSPRTRWRRRHTGTTVTWTATPTGGLAPSAQYAVGLQRQRVSVARDWATANTFGAAADDVEMAVTAVVVSGAQQRQRRRRGGESSTSAAFAILPAAGHHSGDARRGQARAAGCRDHGHLDRDGHRGLAPLQHKWWVFNGTAWEASRADRGTANAFAWRADDVRMARLRRGRRLGCAAAAKRRRCGGRDAGGVRSRFQQGTVTAWPRRGQDGTRGT